VTRSRRLLLVFLMVVLLAAGSASVLPFAVGGGESGSGGEGGVVHEGGPLADPDNASGTTAPVPLRKPYSWGGTGLVNDGDEAATIERIELLDAPEGMRVIGMYVLDSSSSGIGIGKGYEPDGRPKLPGLTIEPGKGYDIVVGLEIMKPGRFAIPATRIHYRVGEQRYQTVMSHAIQLCGPAQEYLNRCSLDAKLYDGG
jgi:hypothetical protein